MTYQIFNNSKNAVVRLFEVMRLASFHQIAQKKLLSILLNLRAAASVSISHYL